MNLKYVLTEPLRACKEEDINAAFNLLDDWQNVAGDELTLEDAYKVFDNFSSGETGVIFASWKTGRFG